MLTVIVRRLLIGIPVLLAATALSFFIIRIVPGDPITTLLNGSPTTPEVEAQLRHQFHLDQPAIVQYGFFLRDLAEGNLGISMRSHRPVTQEIGTRLPSTLKLAGTSALLALVLGLGGGLLASFFSNGPVERLFSLVQLAAVSIPPFWLGLILLTLLSFRVHLFPATGDQGWRSLVLPSITLALPAAAVIAQLLRDGMREVLNEPYITTARAKGLRELVVRRRHVLKNALIPVITVSGTAIGSLLTGTVVIETVFARPGVGRLAVDAILNKDLTVVQGVVVLAAATYLVINIVVDVLYALIDPRIR